jgi:hypothetical protein
LAIQHIGGKESLELTIKNGNIVLHNKKDLMAPLDKIKQFLTNISDISLGYNEINFFDPLKLRDEQVGFSYNTEGNTLVTGNEGDWKEEWIVIANDEMGDPIIVDTSTPQLTVLNASHGRDMGTFHHCRQSR